MTAAVVFASFVGLMLIGVPVVMATAVGTLMGFVYIGMAASLDQLYVFPMQVLEGVDSTALLAIPFFVLAGNLMTAVGVTERIFALANALVGHMRAGLAQVNVIASLFFGGVTGSAIADVAGIGNLCIREMRNRGYPLSFACALTVSSSVIGPTMWPSVPLLIYAYSASVSVERVFLAGIVPGALVVAALMTYNRLIAHRFDVPLIPRPPAGVLLQVSLRSIWALFAPLIVVGSIISGIATPVEAGVVACTYTLVLGACYRTLSVSRLRAALSETVVLTASVVMIIGISTAMSWLMAFDQVPQSLADGVLSLTDSKWVFLGCVAVFFLAVGTVLENIPAMVILIPMMLPLVDHFGVDRVHFGLIVVYGLLIGIVHPPIGIALIIVTRIAGIAFEEVCVAVLPFLLPLILVLLVITFVPATVLWLPNLLLGRP